MSSKAEALFELRDRWYDDRVAFALESFECDPVGRPVGIDPQQRRIFDAVRDYDRVAVRSGRGAGKTAAAAILALHWLATRCPARVVCSAGTWNHLTQKLLPEIRTWFRSWLLKGAWDVQQTGIYSLEDPDGWRLVSESSDRAENVEGHHSPNLLLLIDEAKGMPDEIFAALLASMTSDYGPGTQKVVALSTPPLAKAGWFSEVSSKSAQWKLVHISGLDSQRVSKEYVEEIRQSWGEDSPQYQAYVLGEIPEASSEVVVQSRWFHAAQALKTKEDKRGAVVTCDVAREGDDLCTFGVIENARFGLVRFEDGRPGWLAQSDLMTVVSRCAQAVKQHRARALVLDDTGLGGGVTDRLRQMQSEGAFPAWCSIIGVKFGGKASRDDRFHSAKDELWWTTREALREGLLGLPSDEEIRAWQAPRGSDFKSQVLSPIYEFDSADRIVVLDKRVTGREKTKSLPVKSPDLAHALVLGVRTYLRQSDLPEVLPPPKDQNEALWRNLQTTVSRIKKPPSTDPFRRRR